MPKEKKYQSIVDEKNTSEILEKIKQEDLQQSSSASDQVDSAILTGVGVGVLSSLFGEIYENVVSDAKEMIKDYVKTQKENYKTKITRWIKGKLFNWTLSKKQIASHPVCSLLKKLALTKRETFLEFIPNEQNTKKEFIELFDTLWSKNYLKFGLEAYKTNWYAQSLNLSKNFKEIKKYYSEKNAKDLDEIVLLEKQQLIKNTFAKLKEIKNNKKIQDFVKDFEKFEKAKIKGMANLETNNNDFLEKKEQELINKLKNFKIDQYILESQLLKFNDIIETDKKLNNFLKKNLNNNEIRTSLNEKMLEKTDQWKQKVNEDYNCFNFIVTTDNKNLSRTNSQTSSDSGVYSQSSKDSSANQEIEVSTELLQEKTKYKKPSQEIDQEKQKETKKIINEKFIEDKNLYSLI